jgi:hypothetical protein
VRMFVRAVWGRMGFEQGSSIRVREEGGGLVGKGSDDGIAVVLG